MIYDISKATAPAMPYLGKGTECIKLLLSQTSKDMREPLVPIFFIAMQHFFHRDATIFSSRCNNFFIAMKILLCRGIKFCPTCK